MPKLFFCLQFYTKMSFYQIMKHLVFTILFKLIIFMSKKVTFMHRKNYTNPINTTIRIAFLIEDCHHLFFRISVNYFLADNVTFWLSSKAFSLASNAANFLALSVDALDVSCFRFSISFFCASIIACCLLICC